MNLIDTITSFGKYVAGNWQQILLLTGEHVQLTAISVGLAILIGVPLGILISSVKRLNKPILGLANVLQAIPSMALLGFAIPLLGIGSVPSVAVVILYSLLPIIKNTYTGIESIPPQTLESARGIGLTKRQVLTKVQLPLALPVIMAGVRISAVTAVGLMTIAAFIGAGGLGFLVFSGIRTVNNNQILAGAIPACLLALFVDYLAGVVEKLVTPAGMHKDNKPTNINTRRKQRRIIAVTLGALCTVFIFSFVTRPAQQEKTVVIASKDYTEQMVLAHMVSEMIENRTDISVTRQINLGGTQVCFSALKSGDIDLYIEYTGTAYGDTLSYPSNSDMELVYETVKLDFKKQFGIDVLPQMQFNNTYILAVTQETSTKFGLHRISDLLRVAPQLRSGATLEFLNRDDGMPGLMQAYDFAFGSSVGLDGSQRYVALLNNEIDVVDAFATDGLLKKFDLVALEDDQSFFPPYYAIPVIREKILETYPEIAPILEELGGYLTNSVMMDLNYQVDEKQREPRDVAREFLEQTDLL